MKFPRIECPECGESAAYYPSTGRLMAHMREVCLNGSGGSEMCWVSHHRDGLKVFAGDLPDPRGCDRCGRDGRLVMHMQMLSENPVEHLCGECSAQRRFDEAYASGR